MKKIFLFLLIASCILILKVEAAQEVISSENKFGKFKFSGSIRSRLELWDWFEPGKTVTPKQNDYAFNGNLIRLKAEYSKDDIDSAVEFSIPSFIGLPHYAVSPPPQGALGLGGNYRLFNDGNFASFFLKQAYVKMKNLPLGNSSLKLGRFDFFEGSETLSGDPTIDWIKKQRISQRLIGDFGFTHIQRSFDGFEVSKDTKLFNYTIFGARPSNGVFDLQANGEVDRTHLLYSAINKKSDGMSFDARLFHILYLDGRKDLLRADNRPIPVRLADKENIDIQTFGGHFIKKFGPVDFISWGALQGGEWGSQKHRAFAWDTELGYQPNLPMKPWLRIGRNRTSGDSNPLDRKHKTFFQILPTPRIYALFPFYNMMNMKDLFAQLILRPHKKINLRFDYHNLRLAQKQDLWYIGGGAFRDDDFGFAGRPNASGSRNFANLFDISLGYQITPTFDFNFYFGRVLGGDVIKEIYASSHRGSFFYWELLKRF